MQMLLSERFMFTRHFLSWPHPASKFKPGEISSDCTPSLRAVDVGLLPPLTDRLHPPVEVGSSPLLLNNSPSEGPLLSTDSLCLFSCTLTKKRHNNCVSVCLCFCYFPPVCLIFPLVFVRLRLRFCL